MIFKYFSTLASSTGWVKTMRCDWENQKWRSGPSSSDYFVTCTVTGQEFPCFKNYILFGIQICIFHHSRIFKEQRECFTRKVLLQCPQETRAPAGWGSGLAGPGWTGPKLIILLLERDRNTKSTFTTQMSQDIIQRSVQANNHCLMVWAHVSFWCCGEADSFTVLLLPLTVLFYN